MIKLMSLLSGKKLSKATPWHWSTEPFPAYRGIGELNNIIILVEKDYTPNFGELEPTADGCPRVTIDQQPSKLLLGREKSILISCSKEQDEKLMLLTTCGRSSGDYSSIVGVDAEILFSRHDGCLSEHPVEHWIVRFTDSNGYVVIHNRSQFHMKRVAKIVSWEDCQAMPPMHVEEFEKVLSKLAGGLSRE